MAGADVNARDESDENHPIRQALKRRRRESALLTPTATTSGSGRSRMRQGQGYDDWAFQNTVDHEVYVNTYGRANLLKRDYVEEYERKDGVIEEQGGAILELKQKVAMLESEKAAAVAKWMSVEQKKQVETLASARDEILSSSRDSTRARRQEEEEKKRRDSAGEVSESQRDQQLRFRKVLEAKEMKIQELEKESEESKRAHESLIEEKDRDSKEINRLNGIVSDYLESSQEAELQRQVQTLELKLQTEQAAAKQSELRLREAEEELAIRKEEANALERKALSLEQKLVDVPTGAPDLELHVKHLQKELESQASEVEKARAIKGRLESEQVLKEKLDQALARAERAESTMRSISESKLDNDADQKELQAWKTVMTSKFDEQGPYQILEKYSELEKAILQLTKEKGDMDIALSQATRSKSDLERANAVLAEEGKGLKERLNEMKVASLRHERKISLLQKERDGLKRIIASYDDEELSLNPQTEGADQQQQHAPSVVRVKELEDMLAQEKSHVVTLESELQTSMKKSEELLMQNESFRKRASEINSNLSSIKSEKELISRELNAAVQELVQLKEVQGTRVLHFVQNPEEQAKRDQMKSRIEFLEAENKALTSEIQKSSSVSDEKSSGGAAAAAAAAKVVVLQKQLEVLSKKESRLKLAFAERVQLFKEAVSNIFGFTVEMQTEGQDVTLKCTPMHEEDSLYFQVKKDGKAELLRTRGLSTSLQKEADTFIGSYRSIPAFTANLTMDIFNKQTQC